MDVASMSTCGDHGVFACHVTTAVIFDQLACHGACTAKLRVVSERRGSDEDEHQGQAFYQDHLIACPALGRAKDHTGPITVVVAPQRKLEVAIRPGKLQKNVPPA